MENFFKKDVLADAQNIIGNESILIKDGVCGAELGRGEGKYRSPF